MSNKWIASLVLLLYLEMVQTGAANAALDEGKFVPCYSLLQTLTIVEPSCHYVKDGDTLWDICRKYNVNVDDVKSTNNIKDESVLAIGQRLIIPGQQDRRHIVKKGETLWDIAGLYKVSLDELCQANQQVNPESLKIGTSLVLPQSRRDSETERFTASRSSIESSIFAWPLAGAITSAFGWRSSGFHHGLDIAAAYGESVRAAAAGTVSFTGTKNVYGRMVMIKHADGSESLYAHLSKILVSQGQQVRRGESIGAVGTSGNSTGPHLHFELRKGKKAFNPMSVLR